MLGPTDPNRYYMWTGWDGNDGKGGGPVIANDELGYGWQTYPERLEQAGISWKIYQDIGDGLDKAGVWGFTSDPYIGNYGDNSLLYFFNYQNAAPGSPLYQGARTGTDVNSGGGFFDILAADVKSGRLPQVSWIVAPEAYTEHPAWPAGYGAWYTAGVLNALTSNPEVWSKTALLITFDENDGFFDHVVGPYPNVGGLAGQLDRAAGQRAVRRHGRDAGRLQRRRRTVRPRRARAAARRLAVEQRRLGVLGDVRPHVADPLHRGAVRRRRAQHHPVAAGRLRRPDLGVRFRERVRSRPAAAERRRLQADQSTTPPSYHPTPPAVGSVPTQEPGVRPSRRLGYRLHVGFDADPSKLQLAVKNQGSLGVGLQARSLTVAGRAVQLHDRRRRRARGRAGQPGHLRPQPPRARTASSATSPALRRPTLRVAGAGDHDRGRLTLRIIHGDHRHPVVVEVVDAYGPDRHVKLDRTRRSRSTPATPAAGTTSR